MHGPSIITPFGMLHTVISIIALVAGIVALVRDGRINVLNPLGKTYIWGTVLTCITGFFIFHHGGFGPPHVLGIITLVFLALGWAGTTGKLGYASKHIETLCYTTTVFFHLIPTFTEFFTRFPAGHPLSSSQDDIRIKTCIVGSFFLLLIVLKIQMGVLKKQRKG
jgi:uncharacterized membrane protein